MDPEDRALVKVNREGRALQPQGPPGAISPPLEQRGVNHLIMNCLVPGLGSLVRGRKVMGGAQLGLFVVAFPLMFVNVFLGLALLLLSWVWSVGSGVRFVRPDSGGVTWR